MIHPYSYRWLMTCWVLALLVAIYELARLIWSL